MILTKAVSGLARSGATRSGYPVLLGHKVPLFALSNVARSGATRSNYTSSNPFLRVGGIDRAWGHALGSGVLADSLTKSDQISGTPDTLSFTARGWVPVEGADVILTLGSVNNLRREFGGTVLSTVHRYAGKPAAANMLYDISCIDYTWRLNQRKVSGNYTNASVAAVAASLMTAAADYTLRVDPDIGAELLDQITFTEQALSDALTQLVKRVGGEYLVDYAKGVHLFYENVEVTAPRLVNAVHPTLATIAWTRDLSQVITRCLGNFGGSTALDAIAPGETLLPVDTAAWYLPQGGMVLVGQQRVTYSGLVAAGGGSLVGPGAAPTSAPNATLLPGAGVNVGSHDYAVTFKTATGESIPGPRLTVPVGVFLPPPTAPSTGVPGPGATGPDPGVHDYAVSFVIATGETVPGPRVVGSTDLTPPPTTAPTADSVSPGPGPDPGTHDYAVSFVTATGETLVGPIGSQITTGLASPPTASPIAGAPTIGSGPDPGVHDYAVTFVTSSGETTVGPSIAIATGLLDAPPPPTVGSPNGGSAGPDAGPHDYAVSYEAPGGETIPSGRVTRPADLLAPPAAVVVGVPTYPIAGGLDAGIYEWVMTCCSPYGETTMGPSQSVANIPAHAAPVASPVISLYGSGGSITPGTRQVKVSFFYSDGAQSAPSPASNVVTDAAGTSLNLTVSLEIGGPGVVNRVVYISYGGGPFTGFGNGPGNNTATSMIVSLAGGSTSGITANLAAAAPITVPIGPSGTTLRRVYRRFNQSGPFLACPNLVIANNTQTDFTDATPNAGLGTTSPPTINTAAYWRSLVVTLPTGPPGVTARNVWRTKAGGTDLLFLQSVPNNTTASIIDATNDSGLLAIAPPTTTTAITQRIVLIVIPTGPSGTTGRNIYRSIAGGGPLRFVAAIANNNTTTTFTDTVTDASLGAAAPTVSTALVCQVHVSSVPRGTGGSNGAVLQRRLYRRSAGAGLRTVAVIPDNSTTTYTDTTPNAGLGAAPPVSNTATLRQIPLSALPVGNTLVVARKLYRTPANTGGGTLKLVATINDNTTLTFLDTVNDAALGAAALAVGTAQAAQVQLSAIPLGAAAVTARVVYRTQANASPLLLLTTLGDNTTTAWLDTALDTSLGAVAPSSDTSALQQPQGNVLAGSPTIPCASVAAFLAAGGWAIVGSQNVRYHGISGNAITGIPPSGPGAVTATITYNTTIVAAPMLTGIPATGLGVIRYQILKGDPVNIFVQVDDLDAQAALRVQLPGSDGIIEDEIQDGRLSYTEGRARCQARLDLLAARDVVEGKVGVITVSYVCRDINTQAGATVTVNLGPPVALSGDYLIQRVNVARFNVPHLNPTYTVEASSLRFSAEELLRLLRQGAS